MTRDVEERLRLYSRIDDPDGLEVVRLALNWDQVLQWSPPENPAKTTDARYASYVKNFGQSSWELDAVNPEQLARLVRDNVVERRDADIWGEAIAEEKRLIAKLNDFAERTG